LTEKIENDRVLKNKRFTVKSGGKSIDSAWTGVVIYTRTLEREIATLDNCSKCLVFCVIQTAREQFFALS
jgi:hypothetical protein